MEQYTRKAAASYPVDWFTTKGHFSKSVSHFCQHFHRTVRAYNGCSACKFPRSANAGNSASFPSCVYLRKFERAREETRARACHFFEALGESPSDIERLLWEGRILKWKETSSPQRWWQIRPAPTPFSTQKIAASFFAHIFNKHISQNWPRNAFRRCQFEVKVFISTRSLLIQRELPQLEEFKAKAEHLRLLKYAHSPFRISSMSGKHFSVATLCVFCFKFLHALLCFCLANGINNIEL